MKKSFLGRGWQFPIGVDESGGIVLSAEDQNIQECIRVILGTAPGERLMRPDFGSYIHNYVFRPNTASTASLVSYYAREALEKWEPRIDNIAVDAYPDPSAENVMLISIQYRVRTTNSLENMVYPFYLRREQDL